MSIFIEIKKQADQADQIGDWIIFIIVIFITLFILICDIFILRYKNNAILSTKNITNIMFVSLSGIMHIWGTFITGEHLTYMKNVKLDSCSMWTFLFTYTLGLNIWITAMIVRVIDYAIVGNVLKLKKDRKLCIYNMSAGFVLYMPLFLLSIIAWLLPASYPVNGACETYFSWKIIMAILFGIYMLIFLISACVYSRKINYNLYSETKKLRIIIPLSIIFLIIGITINIVDILNTYIGRIIYTLLICIFHTSVYIILCGYELYKSIKGDKKYMNIVLSRFKKNDAYIQLNTSVDLEKIDGAWDDYLLFCAKQKEFYELDPEFFYNNELKRYKITNKKMKCGPAIIVTLLFQLDSNIHIEYKEYENIIPIDIRKDTLNDELDFTSKYTKLKKWIYAILEANYLENYKEHRYKNFLDISDDPEYENHMSQKSGFITADV